MAELTTCQPHSMEASCPSTAPVNGDTSIQQSISNKTVEKHDESMDSCSEADSEEMSANEMDSKISYKHGQEYWSNQPATVDGMLGGFAHISSTDIHGSEIFLKALFQRKHCSGRARCIDCGAGIGRISQCLLQRQFGVVDMVEQNKAYTEKAREKFAENKKIGNIYCSGLQDFRPKEGIYDLVWIQWVLPYLQDQDLVDFLKRMSKSLKPKGVLCIKENVASGKGRNPNEPILDEEDLSVTRPLRAFVKLANDAQLKLVHSELQKGFPKKLFDVYMLAFKPYVP